METTTNQSKVNTWMRKREQEFIARGWKVSYGTGGSAIISSNLCKKSSTCTSYFTIFLQAFQYTVPGVLKNIFLNMFLYMRNMLRHPLHLFQYFRKTIIRFGA